MLYNDDGTRKDSCQIFYGEEELFLGEEPGTLKEISERIIRNEPSFEIEDRPEFRDLFIREKNGGRKVFYIVPR